MNRFTLALLPLALMGCDPLSTSGVITSAWDPSTVLTTSDGLYIPVHPEETYHRGLVFIDPDGVALPVDLGGDTVRLADITTTTQNSARLIATLEEVRCVYDDDFLAEDHEKDHVYISDCPEDRQDISSTLHIIEDGSIKGEIEQDIKGNRMLFSDDAEYAMSWYDPSLGSPDGVVSLNAVEFIDLTNGTVQTFSLGNRPETVLFTYDSDGSVSGAVFLAQSEVIVVRIDANGPQQNVTFPLTLDPDQVVTPTDVVLTPSGSHAIISLSGNRDLYVLDLDNRSINILELSGVPTDLAVSDVDDETIITIVNRAEVYVLSHDTFSLDVIPVDEYMGRAEVFDGSALLYRFGSRDAYLLDIATRNWDEYRMETTLSAMVFSPDNDFAVATSESWAQSLEVLDLQNGGDSTPYYLPAPAVDTYFYQQDDITVLFVQLQGLEYLTRLDLDNNLTQTVELDEPVIAFGQIPGGQLYATHSNPLGELTFIDPVTSDVTVIRDFALTDLLGQTKLVKEEN